MGKVQQRFGRFQGFARQPGKVLLERLEVRHQNRETSKPKSEHFHNLESDDILHLEILCSQLIPSKSLTVISICFAVSEPLSRQYTVTATPSGFDLGI